VPKSAACTFYERFGGARGPIQIPVLQYMFGQTSKSLSPFARNGKALKDLQKLQPHGVQGWLDIGAIVFLSLLCFIWAKLTLFALFVNLYFYIFNQRSLLNMATFIDIIL